MKMLLVLFPLLNALNWKHFEPVKLFWRQIKYFTLLLEY